MKRHMKRNTAMKKTLIALALVSLPVAASAEVILYGQIKAGAEYTESFEDNGPRSRHDFALADFGSRIGFKGSEDLGNGLKAIWQFEQGINIGSGTWQAGKGRDSFIGLEGGFGRVTAGNVSNPIDANTGAMDQWEGSGNGVTTLDYYTRFSRRNVSVNYYSPNFNGFDFHVQVAPGGDRGRADGVTNLSKATVFGLGLGYKSASGIFARYAGEFGKDFASTAVPPATPTPATTSISKTYQVHNLAVGYDANNLNAQVGFQYGRNVSLDRANPWAGDVNTKEVAVSVAYTAGAVTPKLSVAHGRANDADKHRYTQAIVGADYAFSRRTTGLVSVGWLKQGDRQATNSTWALGTGLVHKF